MSSRPGDYLDDILRAARWSLPGAEEAQRARTRERLRELDRALKAGDNLLTRLPFYYTRAERVRFAPADMKKAERLFRIVRERGGPGSRMVKEGMLAAMAANGAPESLPFWREALAWEQKRDMLKGARHELAITGLALAAFRAGHAESLEALQALALEGETPELQGLAARALWLAPVTLEQEGTADLTALLTRVATGGRALAARYQARLGLRLLERPVPLDVPQGSYTFKAQLGRGFHCLLELPSGALLHDLHLAIQRGFRWDNDHLYTFYLDGADGRAFEVPGLSPDGRPFDDGEYPDAGEWRLGELGFVKGGRLTYLFDFGDSHKFTVTVAAVNDAPGHTPLPHITRSGEPPEQYDDDW